MELVMWQQNLDEDHDDANDSQSTYEGQKKYNHGIYVIGMLTH